MVDKKRMISIIDAAINKTLRRAIDLDREVCSADFIALRIDLVNQIREVK